MALPQAVARKAERAAELMKAQGQPATPAAPVQPQTPVVVVAEDATKLKQQLDKERQEREKAQQQYKTLKGMYDSQMPQLQESNKQLKARLDELEAKAAAAPADYTLTTQERELIGEDMVKIVGKVATEIAEGQVKKHLKPLAERVDYFQRMSEAQYWAVVDQLVPDFQGQNDDPKFIAWLKDVDLGTGQLRDDLLQRAHAAMQGYRVAEIFRAYREGREIGARPTDAPTTPSGPPADQVSPPAGSGSPPAVPAGATGKQWTRAEIREFYADKRRGRYQGKDGQAEARKIELDISAAAREGRIVG